MRLPSAVDRVDPTNGFEANTPETMKRFLFWLTRYFGWLFLAFVSTLGGALLVMLFKDWTLKTLVMSLMAWPALGLAMLIALPVSLLPPRSSLRLQRAGRRPCIQPVAYAVLGDFCQIMYQLARRSAHLRCRASSHIARLCSGRYSLKANENTSQFGT